MNENDDKEDFEIPQSWLDVQDIWEAFEEHFPRDMDSGLRARVERDARGLLERLVEFNPSRKLEISQSEDPFEAINRVVEVFRAQLKNLGKSLIFQALLLQTQATILGDRLDAVEDRLDSLEGRPEQGEQP